MPKTGRCSGCGTPLPVGRGQTWRANGIITQAQDPDHRMIFYESENIDGIFRGIEGIIGVPIERIVIESKAREVKRYVERMVGPRVRRLARHRPGTGMLVAKLSATGRSYGFWMCRRS